MSFEISGVKSLQVKISNEEIMELDSVVVTNIEHSNIEPKKLNWNASINIDNVDINKEVFDELFKTTNEDKYSLIVDLLCAIQRKTHKKKRINKKWLRRYGVNTFKITYDVDNVKFSDIEGNIYFNFEEYCENVMNYIVQNHLYEYALRNKLPMYEL